MAYERSRDVLNVTQCRSDGTSRDTDTEITSSQEPAQQPGHVMQLAAGMIFDRQNDMRYERRDVRTSLDGCWASAAASNAKCTMRTIIGDTDLFLYRHHDRSKFLPRDSTLAGYMLRTCVVSACQTVTIRFCTRNG